MDFIDIKVVEKKQGLLEISPVFLVTRSTDLMVKGRSFYAVWDEEAGLWSTDDYDVQRLVDAKLRECADKYEGISKSVKYMLAYDSGSWPMFQRYLTNLSDNAHDLDGRLIFANQEPKKTDYATKRLPYSLEDGDHSAWDELLGVLYDPEERDKIEWAIGSVVAGESKYLQKFLVFYGPSGTGKSTILNIIQKLFEGYTATFDAKALGSSSQQFATEVFKHNPLVAIQHDGDLSKIEDNTKLNSIISHEDMVVNEKYKSGYTTKINSFLFMGTNTPVKISDAKSGLIRRLIDVEPTGNKIPSRVYRKLMKQVEFEYGAIAKHCLDKYKIMGFDYYDGYRPTSMMYKTDPVLNFISDNYDFFSSQEYITMKQVYDLYKRYAEEAGVEKPLSRMKLLNELSNYFDEFHDRLTVDTGERKSSVFSGFNMEKATSSVVNVADPSGIDLREQESIFDLELAQRPAQLAKPDGTPSKKWDSVKTVLRQIPTDQLHYVDVPENHIVIDFDLKDEDGNKSLECNLEAAESWPPTYTEVSKSGQGLHLHYIFDGDTDTLASEYSEGIEVKVYRGNASLRRKLTLCNNLPITHISSGLPRKEKKVASEQYMQTERSIRNLIDRNLRKEIHPGTKPSVEFIKHILDEAYESGVPYDVSDMRGVITTFAANSSNHSLEMIRLVKSMKFASETVQDPDEVKNDTITEEPIVFYDVEVYPNLFVVCWKYQGSSTVQALENPTPEQIENLFKYKLVGFNNRRYDNHILYARYLGYSNEQLYTLSQAIINSDRSVMFREAYNLSFADIYDFSSKKQSLKKFEIELGINHMEMEIPWDQPVDEDMIPKVVEYCKNDVNATEAVFEARKADFTAREVLAELSELPINSSTQAHTAKIIFGDDKNPQSKFVYTDLSKDFPGYEFDEFASKNSARSVYRGEEVGEGGYVYSEPGCYKNVAVLDIASMHPNSIRALNLFGPYTKNFTDLVDARVAIKHRDFDSARKMLDGKLAPFLKEEAIADDLAYALKIIINTVYGLTAAKFPNKFKDPRNKDNIVAKRGALFMVDLKHFVQERGYSAIHIKTDSIKIPGATPEIIKEVTEFGAKYGYTFEHESTYDRICLVNKAVYIAKEGDKWEAVGAEFQHPYIYKKLFLGEGLTMDDYVETKQVSKGSIYICDPEDEKTREFVGRIGTFIPVKKGTRGAGELMRVVDGKAYAVAGTKGYLWMRETAAKSLGVDCVDMSYFDKLEQDAIDQIERFENLEWMLNG